MTWNPQTHDKFKLMISKIPVFHRGITEEAVTKRAHELAEQRKALSIDDQDVVGAFFTDVPSPFYSMMVRLLEQAGFDYRKCGYPRTNNT